jgi:hypothetical protein
VTKAKPAAAKSLVRADGKCSCRCGDKVSGRKIRPDLSERCYRRWLERGKPDGPMPLPFGHAARKGSREGPPPAPGEACGCGHCGLPATRPARDPFISEQCYRRSLDLKLGGYEYPPPRKVRTRKDGGPPRKPDPPKPAPAPEPPPPPPAPDLWAEDAARRIPAEIDRAAAYMTAISRSDHLGTDRVCSKVDDLDAFDALLDAGLDIEKATRLLTRQLETQFPDPQEAAA